jgi:pilus assembly protein CpaB
MFVRPLLRRRWPLASKVFAGLSIACGLTAALLVHGMESRLAAAHPPLGTPVSVVVAAVDAARGTTVRTETVRVEHMPSIYVPPGALSDVDQAVGRVLLADIAAGEVLTRTRATAHAGGPVAALVPPGLRAVAVSVVASARDLRPGDHVDLLAAFGGGAPHTETVAEGLEVLRVTEASSGAAGSSMSGINTGPVPGEKASLLVLVSPDVAGRIAFAQAFASLSVAIVPAHGDDQEPAMSGAASPDVSPDVTAPEGASGSSTPSGSPVGAP